MTSADLETENSQLLLSVWSKLRDGLHPSRMGLSHVSASVIAELDKTQVTRAAQVHTPLFTPTSQLEVLAGAFELEPKHNEVCMDTLLFLTNRWRAAESSPAFSQLYFGMSKALHQLFKSVTFMQIQAAASSGIAIMSLNVRPQYFLHAGSRFDFQTSQRTKLAICNNINVVGC